jgi:UDP-2,3-diacylglucosamine pyrophosphatase LpxH
VSVKPRFIISDLHLGEGRQSKLEDFDEQDTENFVSFFHEVSSMGGVKVLINGDFIDFPQVILGNMSSPPQKFLGTTEMESTRRLRKVITGHPDEFEALKNFLTQNGNKLLLIPGNHDVDFCWNRVLKTFQQRIGATDENFKFGMVYKEAGVYVTHGHQYSDDNRIDVPVDFTFNRLNSCWGTHFVEKFFNTVEDIYPLLDNARPLWKVALSAILHEELLVTAQFVAEFLMFLKNFRMPLKDYVSSAIFGWQPKSRSLRKRNIDALTSRVYLDNLREKLQELRADPEFKRKFDATFQELDDIQWNRLLIRSKTAEREVKELLQESETEAQSRSLFSKTDNYQQAAKFIARHHPTTRAVIMGHTHYGIDAKKLKVEDGRKKFLYFNTGTWTKTYDIPWWKLPRLDELDDPALFMSSSGVVRCTGAGESLKVKYFDSWKDAVSDM